MKTTTIYRKIPIATVPLARILRRIANRPQVSRAIGFTADEIEAELLWRANAAQAGA